MGWVTPRTYVDGEQVTKPMFVDWNNSIAAAGNHTGWTTWAAAGSNLGTNYTVAGRKLKVGKLGVAHWTWTWASSGVGTLTSAGSLPIALTLPWAASTAGTSLPAGFAYLYEAVADNTWLMVPYVISGSEAYFRYTVAGSSVAFAIWRADSAFVNGAPIADWNVGWPNARAGGMIAYRTNT